MSDFSTIAPAFLPAAIQGQVIDFKPIDKALSLAVDAGLPTKVDWKKLTKYKAIDWCKTVTMSGSESGLGESHSRSQKAALSGRIYQQAYSSRWVSYAQSTRAKRVTHYQLQSECMPTPTRSKPAASCPTRIP